MTTNEIIAITISILSLTICILSLIFSKINMTRVERIYYGQTEIGIRESITSSKKNVAYAIQDISQNPYKDQIVKFAIEEFLNSYEEACAKYIDKKVDRKRFKRTYSDEIKNLVESDDLKKYFQFGSQYDAIKKVYEEWFNLEV